VFMSAMDSPNSIESFGCLIRAGIDDPFGYGDPVPRSNDDESSFDDYFDDSKVHDTFSFLHPGGRASPSSLETPSRSPTDSPGSVIIMRPAVGEKMFCTVLYCTDVLESEREAGTQAPVTVA
jgi:hypothetical protein